MWGTRSSPGRNSTTSPGSHPRQSTSPFPAVLEEHLQADAHPQERGASPRTRSWRYPVQPRSRSDAIVTSAAPTPGRMKRSTPWASSGAATRRCLETQVVQREEDALRVAGLIVDHADHPSTVSNPLPGCPRGNPGRHTPLARSVRSAGQAGGGEDDAARKQSGPARPGPMNRMAQDPRGRTEVSGGRRRGEQPPAPCTRSGLRAASESCTTMPTSCRRPAAPRRRWCGGRL